MGVWSLWRGSSELGALAMYYQAAPASWNSPCIQDCSDLLRAVVEQREGGSV